MKNEWNIKTHLVISCIGYMMLGFNLGISFGKGKNLSPELVLAIQIIAILIFGLTVFTSLEKVKKALRNDREGDKATKEAKEGEQDV